VLSAAEVLPGVPDIVTEIQVEAVFDDGTRLAVITDPFRGAGSLAGRAPGAVLPREQRAAAANGPGRGLSLAVCNTGEVPISVTSHFHFFEVNRRLAFNRPAAYGLRLDIPAGSSTRFAPGAVVKVCLVPIGGARIAIGFSGLVDGPLDATGAREAAVERARAEGYAMSFATKNGNGRGNGNGAGNRNGNGNGNGRAVR
jgi:urease subunit gamma/beta